MVSLAAGRLYASFILKLWKVSSSAQAAQYGISVGLLPAPERTAEETCLTYSISFFSAHFTVNAQGLVSTSGRRNYYTCAALTSLDNLSAFRHGGCADERQLRTAPRYPARVSSLVKGGGPRSNQAVRDLGHTFQRAATLVGSVLNSHSPFGLGRFTSRTSPHHHAAMALGCSHCPPVSQSLMDLTPWPWHSTQASRQRNGVTACRAPQAPSAQWSACTATWCPQSSHSSLADPLCQSICALANWQVLDRFS